MGVIFVKKFKCFQTGATECGPFPPKGCLPSGRKRADEIFFYQFEFKIKIEQGSLLHKKLLQSKVTIVGIGNQAQKNFTHPYTEYP